jgi:hypothetical protein
MSNSKHTPGPWAIVKSTLRYSVEDGQGNEIASCPGDAQGYAEAALIAAAPDLFAAMSELVAAHEEIAACDLPAGPSMDAYRRIDSAHVAALEAMAKAEGGRDHA